MHNPIFIYTLAYDTEVTAKLQAPDQNPVLEEGVEEIEDLDPGLLSMIRWIVMVIGIHGSISSLYYYNADMSDCVITS